jgi:large subunit ribosomal protein L22
MESTAILRFNGLSAMKMRQVADLVRGKDVDVALHTLRFITKAAARPMEKLITSAVANAREKANAADERFDADAYYVKTVMVDGGPMMKRFRPRAQGRAYKIRKRSCHVNLVLAAHDTVPAKPQRKTVAAAKAAPAATPKAKAKVKVKAKPKAKGKAKSKAKAKGKAKGEAKSGAKREKKSKAAAAAK